MAQATVEDDQAPSGDRPSQDAASARGAFLSLRRFAEAISQSAGADDAPPSTGRARGRPALAATPGMNDVALVLGHAPADLEQGRRILSLFGDPLRREILETLAERPGTNIRALLDRFAAPRADIDNRLAAMKRAHLVEKGRYSSYRLSPDALLGVRAYFDVLTAAASWSGSRSEHVA